MEGFKAIGLSFKNTPLDMRERVAFQDAEATHFLVSMKEMFGVEEAMLVSTCNRTEVYYSAEDDLNTSIISLLCSLKNLKKDLVAGFFQNYDSAEATRHLFEVSLGLDSQVLGDIQISNQIKRAYQLSADLSLAGPHLHRLMHTIFFANKRVVQETSLQDGTASVASVATDLIQGFISNIQEPRIALIGLGEIGKNALENLSNAEAQITLVNRTRSKAEALANEKGFRVEDFSSLMNVISENDVIISAVAVAKPMIRSQAFDAENLHKLLIDLSVPRSISQEVERIPGISLYNVDQLTEKTQKAKEIREKAIPDARLIIEEEIRAFGRWKNEMEVSPTIQKLKSALDQIRVEELARHKKLSESEVELLEVVTKNIVQKVIKLPVLQLKAACKRGEAESMVELLHSIFNLEEAKTEQK